MVSVDLILAQEIDFLEFILTFLVMWTFVASKYNLLNSYRNSSKFIETYWISFY